jgi:hypothetical protein
MGAKVNIFASEGLQDWDNSAVLTDEMHACDEGKCELALCLMNLYSVGCVSCPEFLAAAKLPFAPRSQHVYTTKWRSCSTD